MFKSDIFTLVHKLFLSVLWIFFCSELCFFIGFQQTHLPAVHCVTSLRSRYSTLRSTRSSSQYLTTLKPGLTNLTTMTTTTITTKQPQVGHWFNKGLQYPHCGASTYQFTDCDKFTTSQPAIDKDYFHEPNYTELAKRLICTLQKLNCPQEATSFQIHDIPCQSSCLAYLAVCGQWSGADPTHLNSPPYEPPPSCPVTTFRNRNFRSNDAVRRNAQYNLNHYPSFTNPYDRYTAYDPLPHSKRIARIPNYSPYVPHALPNSNPYPLRKTNRNVINEPGRLRNPYRPWHLNRERRITKLGSSQSRSMQRISPNLNMIPYHSNGDPLQFSPNSQRPITRILPLTVSDCLFLPPGGCDKWSDFLTNLNQFGQPDFRNSLKLNPECPVDTMEKCSAMFPRTFSRTQWVKGNFTIAAIVRITGTLWWFGKGGRFQPMVRFSVQKTLDSDIHPYDDKMILTYSWPMQCVCPDEITVGKRYLMLTHSYKPRQSLHLTTNTVFLSRVKRFTKKLACWKGACAHGHGGIREQRYRPMWKRDKGI